MKNCILVVGAESSGTRIFSHLITKELGIHGKATEKGHEDALDELWKYLYKINEGESDSMPSIKHDFVLTRRSMPHSGSIDRAAGFKEFPDLNLFYSYLNIIGCKCITLVTTRNPLKNLESCVKKRASCGGDYQKALIQYESCYDLIFNSITGNNIPYYILSLEGLILEGDLYIKDVCNLINYWRGDK
jgi:hypothetical protein